MSGNLFLNTDNSLQRIETLLRQMREFNFASSEHKTAAINSKEATIYYTGTVTGRMYNGEHIYINVDAESFPDMYSKLSDQLAEKLKNP